MFTKKPKPKKLWMSVFWNGNVPTIIFSQQSVAKHQCFLSWFIWVFLGISSRPFSKTDGNLVRTHLAFTNSTNIHYIISDWKSVCHLLPFTCFYNTTIRWARQNDVYDAGDFTCNDDHPSFLKFQAFAIFYFFHINKFRFMPPGNPELFGSTVLQVNDLFHSNFALVQ